MPSKSQIFACKWQWCNSTFPSFSSFEDHVFSAHIDVAIPLTRVEIEEKLRIEEGMGQTLTAIMPSLDNSDQPPGTSDTTPRPMCLLICVSQNLKTNQVFNNQILHKAKINNSLLLVPLRLQCHLLTKHLFPRKTLLHTEKSPLPHRCKNLEEPLQKYPCLKRIPRRKETLRQDTNRPHYTT